jgi:hypothetical protein
MDLSRQIVLVDYIKNYPRVPKLKIILIMDSLRENVVEEDDLQRKVEQYLLLVASLLTRSDVPANTGDKLWRYFRSDRPPGRALPASVTERIFRIV